MGRSAGPVKSVCKAGEEWDEVIVGGSQAVGLGLAMAEERGRWKCKIWEVSSSSASEGGRVPGG
jgi:hypothetical protein